SSTVLPTRQGTWTELRWSEPGLIPDDAGILDVVSWHGGYVAVGDVAGVDGHVAAAFISADGVRWERTSTFPANPAIVATPTRLIALVNRPGPPQAVEAWASLDGRSWQRDESLALSGASFGRLAAHARTIVAIGTDAAGRSATTTPGQNPRSPLLWFSTDARDWRIVGPPAHWGRASANGRQAVIFAAADFGTVALGAWASQDERGWNQLSFSGDVAEMPAFETAVGQSTRVDSVFAEPN